MKKFCFLLFFFLLCIKFEYFDSFFFVLYKYNVCFEYLKKTRVTLFLNFFIGDFVHSYFGDLFHNNIRVLIHNELSPH